MADKLGDFVLVLHAHLPYVLHHGTWPHGEDWLYEAAAETYLPILGVIDEIHHLGGWPGITIGLTPVLLEQLAHEKFKQGLADYFADRIERARSDRKDFARHEDGYHQHLVYLSEWWEQVYTRLSNQFEDIGRDIPKAFADAARAGSIEILTSAATHGFFPLLLEDSSIRAQMRAGMASSQRILGFKPTGMWLPECAYRPAGPWTPPAVFNNLRNRIGVGHLVADEGVDHFFVEHHLIEQSRSEGVYDGGNYHRVGWDEGAKYPARGWYSVNESFWVNSDGGPGRVQVMGRDPRICEQVWSGSIGYPADGIFLEFHRKYGERRGLRYWRVTGKDVDLGQKELYDPYPTTGKVHSQAQHFCDQVKAQLAAHRDRTGRQGMVVACFDAELFGHWWFEGPRFLRDMLLNLHHDPQVNLVRSSDRVKQSPPDKVVAMPSGSWGDGGDSRVWFNEQTRWIWEVEYRAEAQFGRLTYNLPWRDPKNKQLRTLLEKAGRELLLMQASDWPFVITRGQAVDYGIKRFVLHAGRFENLVSMAEKVGAGETLTAMEEFEIQDADLHDVIFPEIDLNWWSM
jgi:1,4-alpha-glucan branching enzyme